jgi:hypothetical protein
LYQPTRKATILDLSPKNAKGRAYSFYYFVRDIIVSFGAFFGAWLWKFSPAVNFFTASTFGVAGILHFVIYCKVASRKETSITGCLAFLLLPNF